MLEIHVPQKWKLSSLKDAKKYTKSPIIRTVFATLFKLSHQTKKNCDRPTDRIGAMEDGRQATAGGRRQATGERGRSTGMAPRGWGAPADPTTL